MGNGKVYFVGAGPGDVRLITLKGKTLLEKADVIMYDRLVNPRLLEYAKATCEFIYCGKLPTRHYMKQTEIHALLIEKAGKGLQVVRLKGGDPSVFGRVGEEADAVSEHGIPYEMVPGITSGIAAPLYAGLPVTHRDFASSFAVMTAHDQSGKPALNWKGLAGSVQTLVFYMGIKNVAYICENLIKNGKSPSLPVMVIQWGTWGRQRSIKGTLENIQRKINEHEIRNPAIIVVGDIVSFQRNSWFEKKPLIGRNIMAIQSGEEENLPKDVLREQGAEVIEWPKWKVTEATMDQVDVDELATFDSLLFTSKTAVQQFFSKLAVLKIDVRQIRGQFYASTPSIKAVLEEYGFVACLQQDHLNLETCLTVGSRGAVQSYSKCQALITHEQMIDNRFTDIVKREVAEFPVDILLFSNRTCVELFMQEAESIGMAIDKTTANIHAICVSEEAKEAAIESGFKLIHVPSGDMQLTDDIKKL
ncbi:uroporphyrinogen-III C-methyltransferase [Bacillus changyiensis]|uniref:uroporphyrinogen-III C-methyltransferase n=1 Tax=Bacillus changyiensis TaxID=3004103 RepID=UPI0022E6E5D5|nr:uroporphyrinogen-III C-methyltransferase [Bacillus changyiensis]MDA1477839.1 uroporphyrinogen-III C-methyltransferase [Bacillus changyiensis]